MKTRESFVTNSSSCSFILIGKELSAGDEIPEDIDDIAVYNGETFGCIDYHLENGEPVEEAVKRLLEKGFKVFHAIFYTTFNEIDDFESHEFPLTEVLPKGTKIYLGTLVC